MRRLLPFLIIFLLSASVFTLAVPEKAGAIHGCAVTLDAYNGTTPLTINWTLSLGCQGGPWHYTIQVFAYDDTDGDGIFTSGDDDFIEVFEQITTFARGLSTEFTDPASDEITLDHATADFYFFSALVATHSGADHSGDGDYNYLNAPHSAIFAALGAGVQEFFVSIVTSDDTAAPTTIQAESDDGSRALDAWVVNNGSATLNEVVLNILNDTDVVVDSAVVQSVIPQAEVQTEMLFAVPTVEADYAFKLRGVFDNGTGTPTDDITRWYNFTLQIVAPDTLGPGDFIIGSAQLLQNPISTDRVTQLLVTVENTGQIEIRLGLWTVHDPDDLFIVPDLQITTPALAIGEARVFTFSIKALQGGDHTIRARAAEADDSGSIVSETFRERTLILSVIDVPTIITLSVDDLGIDDAILQGKIESLGGFPSARAYFVIWPTATPASAVQVPDFGEIVTFVSSFRQYIDFLIPSTNYSYSFRLAYPGGEAQGGVVQFATPAEFRDPLTGLRNNMARALSLDSIAMGAILGIGVMFLIVTMFLIVSRDPAFLTMAGVSSAGLNMIIGWWPPWLFILLALIAGLMIVQRMGSGVLSERSG